MCGIAGIVLKQNVESIDLSEALKRMANSMSHRGPDDEGLFITREGRAGLVSRRLAVRDLSASGHMPMHGADGRVSITYNGEIYNAGSLRTALESQGCVFRSGTDTEVILHGYVKWGKDVVHKLRGMFAFAVLDQRGDPMLLLSRDHMGVKPLYHAQSDLGFVFASELKTILAAGFVSHEVSSAGLVGYLTLGSVPNPHTIYRDISALPPASLLQVDLRTLAGAPCTYWSLPTNTVKETSFDEAVVRVRQQLAEVVGMRMVSDVPIGAFLSGGLDSSSVVTLMHEATNTSIRTCSMVFEESAYSEKSYSRDVAKLIDADHYERVITAGDLSREFDNILAAMDQPSNDGVNTYFASQTARHAGLTVALSGLGGDELFGGYPNTFFQVPKVYKALQITSQIPGGSALMHSAIRNLSGQNGWLRIADALQMPVSPSNAYLSRRGFFSRSEVQSLVSPDIWNEALKTFDPIRHVEQNAGTAPNGEFFNWIARAELRTYTHHQLLRDTDIMSMVHSLEVRVPFLDHVLVESMLQLSQGIKMQNNSGPKPLLSAAMKDALPRIVLNRKDKMGFTFPFAVWLNGTLQKQVSACVASLTDYDFLQPTSVEKVQMQFRLGRIHWSRLWALMALRTLSTTRTRRVPNFHGAF